MTDFCLSCSLMNQLYLRMYGQILLIDGLSHYLEGFVHPRWCMISSINSMTKEVLNFIIRVNLQQLKEIFSSQLFSSEKALQTLTRWWFQTFFSFSPLAGEDFQFHIFCHMGVSENRGTPKWMVDNGNPIEMDDLGAIFLKWVGSTTNS